jgi:hypothetical protein
VRLASAVRAFLAAAFGLSLLLCLVLFYEFSWRWRDCFNDQGRCFDEAESVVYHQQSGEVWGLLAVLSAVGLAAFLSLRPR